MLTIIQKELTIMRTLNHHNILNYNVAFIHGSEVWLTMHIMEGGSVYDIMKMTQAQGIKDEGIRAYVLYETLKGLEYFHNSGQIHRDIKCSNILLDLNGKVFLGDFGVAAKIKKGTQRTTFVGSPCWMAPEIIGEVNIIILLS